MIYGFITSIFLPRLFLNNISIFHLNNKTPYEQNLKEEFDSSIDIYGMKKVLRKIFTFERFVFISNTID